MTIDVEELKTELYRQSKAHTIIGFDDGPCDNKECHFNIGYRKALLRVNYLRDIKNTRGE